MSRHTPTLPPHHRLTFRLSLFSFFLSCLSSDLCDFVHMRNRPCDFFKQGTCKKGCVLFQNNDSGPNNASPRYPRGSAAAGAVCLWLDWLALNSHHVRGLLFSSSSSQCRMRLRTRRELESRTCHLSLTQTNHPLLYYGPAIAIASLIAISNSHCALPIRSTRRAIVTIDHPRTLRRDPLRQLFVFQNTPFETKHASHRTPTKPIPSPIATHQPLFSLRTGTLLPPDTRRPSSILRVTHLTRGCTSISGQT